jgi:8-oxo-dGTP diphosphatase
MIALNATAAMTTLGTRLAEAGLGSDLVELDVWPQESFTDIPWFPVDDRTLWLDQLTSWDRRRGVGRAAMAELCQVADEHECRIGLNPWAQDYPDALRQDEIETFYGSLGFGWRRDHVMVREPLAQTVFHVQRDLRYQPTPNRSEFVFSDTMTGRRDTATSFVFPFLKTGELVMAQSLKPGRDVEPGGGHIEPGEDQVKAALREGFEELCARLGTLVPIGHQRMLTGGIRPEGWRYPFPLAYQAFFTARVESMEAYIPNDECGPPILVTDLTTLPPHLRLLALRARLMLRLHEESTR